MYNAPLRKVEKVVKLFYILKALPAREIQSQKEEKAQAEEADKLAKKHEIIAAKKAKLHRQIKELDPNNGTSFSPE